MNPHELFGIEEKDFNPGAELSPIDVRDHKYAEVGFGSPPFDWTVGYDVERDIDAVLGTQIDIPTKNQNGSGSCGGQSDSYYGAAISAFHDKHFEEKSAKFSYAPVAVKPGGGSNGRDLADRAIKAGWAPEALTPSYEAGNPPSEAFMQRTEDITPEATQVALKDRALSYALVDVNIDAVAQAIRDNKGVRVGVTGSNNGTWLSQKPLPPKDGETWWRHWLWGGKAFMVDGKKSIIAKNSWGLTVGDNGWQILSEDFFTTYLHNDLFGGCPIWEPRTYVFNPNPLPTSFHHNFVSDLLFGQSGGDIVALQTALQIDGTFPKNVPCTGLYGDITRRAVLAYQLKYQVAPVAVLTALQGKKVGPATRAQLNHQFN